MMGEFDVAVVGGVPAALGGGGLELQRDSTITALARRGHRPFLAAAVDQRQEFDLLHAFGSEGDVQHLVHHWRLQLEARLVISPVLVAPQRAEKRLRLEASVRGRLGTRPSPRSELLKRADALIALTEHERSVLSSLAPSVPVFVVGNGVDPSEDPGRPDLGQEVQPGYLLHLGTISRRKRQAETLQAVSSLGLRHLLVGAFHGTREERHDFERVVRLTGAEWIGEVTDRHRVNALIRGASALVHFSDAEGQSLAMLEALAAGVPVLCSALPQNRELAERYPSLMHVCSRPADLERHLRELPAERLPADVPSWDDVASQVEKVYRSVLGLDH